MRRLLPCLRALPVLGLACLASACPSTSGDGTPGLSAALEANPPSVIVGSSIRFDAGASTDSLGVEARFSDTALTGFEFDLGDGSVQSSDSWYIDHVYAQTGEFLVRVTVAQGDDQVEAEVTVTVSHPPPTVLAVDLSADDKAVIGEWVTLEGRGFREDNVPAVQFEGVPANEVLFLSEFQFAIQVPPRTPSGPVWLEVDFPEDDEADFSEEIQVARYALATDAWRGRAYVVEMGEGRDAWPISQSLELPDAAVVAISGDGSFALLGDARYQATLSPSVVVVDLTSDFHPVVTTELNDLGEGPLFDLTLARDVPIAVVTDATGFVVLDFTDPAHPVPVGPREVYDFSDMAPTAVALSPDATRLAVLSTFNDRVRFYSITPTGPIYESDFVTVGEGCQDLAVLDDEELLYVLGGGGEGAIPPDLSLDNSSLTLVDFSTDPAENLHGDDSSMPLGASVPSPIDLAVGPSGTAYVSTLDTNLGDTVAAFESLATNPLDIAAWQSVIESIAGIGFGAVVPVSGALEGLPDLQEGLFSAFGFQAGLDVRYDEQLYVATAIGLGTTLEFLTDDELFHLSLDIDYAVAVGDLTTGEVETWAQFSEPVVSYVDFQLNYDLGPLVALLLPPYAFGDVAIQP